MSFCYTEFPWQASMLDASQWRRTGTACIAADQDVVGVSFRDSRCNHADANFADQFHTDTSAWVCVLQVVDQLRQVFDRIDIVMRWRANQSDAGCAVANPGNVLVDFLTRQFAPFTGLGTLRDLDL